MRVLLVSQYYSPENVPIPSDVATGLRELGHEVRVLTGYPNYPQGNLYAGYRQRWRYRERIDGVEVLRVPLYADHSQSAFRRMLNYFSFALSSATARGFARGADVIYVYATQMTPALGPWLWRMTGGVPYVLHVQDLWPDSIIGSSLTRGRQGQPIKTLLNPWIARVYRRAAAVIGIAPTMVSTLVERGVPRDRAELLFNWAEGTGTSIDSPEPSGKRAGIIRVVYGGNIGDMQDLETAIRAAAETAAQGVHLTLIGSGVEQPRLELLVEELGIANVEFLPPVPRDRMSEIYAEADFGLVTLKDLPAFRGTIPSKFQAALAHGLPVITTVQGDVRHLTEQHGLGFTADTESVQDLARAFRWASACDAERREDLASNAREAAVELFSRTRAITQIEFILRSAVKERRIKK